MSYCSQVKDILGCLQESRNFPNLDSDCMNALKQVIDTEWKFDSQLNSNCKGDISFHCPLSVGVMEATRCLTRKFRSKELTKKCNFYFKDLLKEVVYLYLQVLSVLFIVPFRPRTNLLIRNCLRGSVRMHLHSCVPAALRSITSAVSFILSWITKSVRAAENR